MERYQAGEKVTDLAEYPGRARAVPRRPFFFGALCLTGTVAVAQRGAAKDSCDAVHTAYRMSFQADGTGGGHECQRQRETTHRVRLQEKVEKRFPCH
jgi:hypothetical protein